MSSQKPLWLRLCLIFAIAVILSVMTALLLLVGLWLLVGTSHNTRWSEIVGAFFLFLTFAFIFITAAIPIAALPAIFLGRRMGWMHSLATTLSISIPLGLFCAIISNAWWLGQGWGWLILGLVGAADGLVGGFLWWHWIGKFESEAAGQMMEKRL
jgi:hypothetical protein